MLNKGIIILFAWCWLLQGVLHAQCVEIRSADLGVAFASVRLGDRSLSTNEKGRCCFDPGISLDTLVRVKVTAMGYEDLVTMVTMHAMDTLIVLELNPLSTHLQEVTVSGSLREVIRSESPIPVETFQRSFLDRNPSPQLFDAVQMVNGIQPQINCNVCSTGDIHINGMEGPYTMVTLDGIPLVSSLSTVYGLMGIPSSLIERIEVIRGSASTVYGSEAMAGVINIITRSPLNAPRFSLETYASSDQEYNIDLGASYRLGNVHALTGVNTYYFDHPFDRNADGFTDLTLQKRLSLFQKLHWGNKQQHDLALRFFTEDRWGGQMDWTPQWAGSDSVYGETIQTQRAEIMGSSVFNPHLKLQYGYNYHQQHSWYGQFPFNAYQSVAFSQWLFHQQWGKHQFMAGLPIRYTYYNDGLDLRPTTGASGFLQNQDHSLLPGIFVQDDWKLDSAFTLSPGVRYDWHSAHGNIITPRLAIRWKTRDRNILRLNAGSGYRVVNVFTEDHAALTGSRMVILGEDLKPERNLHLSLHFDRDFTFRRAFLNVNASLFDTYFLQRIVADYDTDPQMIYYRNQRTFSNVGGAGLNVFLSHASGIRCSLGATYLIATQESVDSSGAVRRIEQWHTPPLTISYDLTLPLMKWGLTCEITGKLFSPMALPVLPNDFRPDHSPWYSLLNAKVEKTFSKRWKVYIAGKNLLNFVPKDPLMRPFDPFDKNIAIDNPNGYTFDTAYNYASLQGFRLLLGLKYTFQ